MAAIEETMLKEAMLKGGTAIGKRMEIRGGNVVDYAQGGMIQRMMIEIGIGKGEVVKGRTINQG